MKKIINGKLYNTETAEKIAESWNGLPQSDFNHLTAKLFRKKTGEFFFWFIGGALTIAAESYGGAMHGGEKIVPCDLEDAKEFCERNLDVDDYVKIFGEVEE